MIINSHNPYRQTALTATLFTFCSRRRSYPHTQTHTPVLPSSCVCLCVTDAWVGDTQSLNAMCWLCWGLGWLSAPVCIHAEACQRMPLPPSNYPFIVLPLLTSSLLSQLELKSGYNIPKLNLSGLYTFYFVRVVQCRNDENILSVGVRYFHPELI